MKIKLRHSKQVLILRRGGGGGAEGLSSESKLKENISDALTGWIGLQLTEEMDSECGNQIPSWPITPHYMRSNRSY